jgi:signal transduction histidine kinase
VDVAAALVVAVAALSVAWLLGTVVGRQVETARLNVQLETARDVHDVVGHALGVISAEAGVTRSLPDAGADELRASLEEIEQHARRALEEVQGLVRALRSGPALADLPSVVAATRAAGIDLDTDIDLAVRHDERVGAVAVR